MLFSGFILTFNWWSCECWVDPPSFNSKTFTNRYLKLLRENIFKMILYRQMHCFESTCLQSESYKSFLPFPETFPAHNLFYHLCLWWILVYHVQSHSRCSVLHPEILNRWEKSFTSQHKKIFTVQNKKIFNYKTCSSSKPWINCCEYWR